MQHGERTRAVMLQKVELEPLVWFMPRATVDCFIFMVSV
jgi:hypothetical protein